MFLFTVALSILSTFLSGVSGALNVTIDDTDQSIIYTGAGERAKPCIFNGTQFAGGQPGCFLNGPEPCSTGARLISSQSGSLSMTFNGTAIYLNALLNDISNVYTLSLDGNSKDVDGVRPGGALGCHTLASFAGLDPSAEHTIGLSIKGLADDRNRTHGNASEFFFWLDNFVITVPDNTTATVVSSSSVVASSASASTATPSATSAGLSNHAHTLCIIGVATLAIGLVGF